MAKRKIIKDDPIQNASVVPDEAYVTWGDDLESKREALKQSAA